MLKVKVIVTGGAGFIGSHLVDFLIKKNYEVLVIDNLSSGNKNNLNPKALFKKLDIRNESLINSCFTKFKPDFVVHLAAVASLNVSYKNRVIQTNVLGTVNILKACVKNKVKKIIFSSSAAVYGESDNFPVYEKQKLKPINTYGVSKVKAESQILLFSKKYNLKYSILRYSNVYGPKQRSDSEGGVVSIFCDRVNKSEKMIIKGNGKQTRDFIYVDCVTRANYLSIISPANFTANVSTNKETTILKLIKIIEKVSKKKPDIVFKTIGKDEIIRSCLNNSLIKQMLNWKPKTKLEIGIKKTYSYVTHGKKNKSN